MREIKEFVYIKLLWTLVTYIVWTKTGGTFFKYLPLTKYPPLKTESIGTVSAGQCESFKLSYCTKKTILSNTLHITLRLQDELSCMHLNEIP